MVGAVDEETPCTSRSYAWIVERQTRRGHGVDDNLYFFFAWDQYP